MDNFNYLLPEGKIPDMPANQRADSRLLYYNQGNISDHSFSQIGNLLQAHSLLFFNNSRVFPARLIFFSLSGARIEIFLLEPYGLNHAEVMHAVASCRWKCMIGNKRKWKYAEVLQINGSNGITLNARMLDEAIVEFSWSPDSQEFESVLNATGNIPLPPYLKRAATAFDKERYQTVYASVTGAVAAPTAGLHFTSSILKELYSAGIETEYLTLHVGAGTFLPVKSDDALEHTMHAEVMVFSRDNLDKLIQHSGPVIAVGTTAMRSLESLYWIGVNLILFNVEPQGSHLSQEFPYGHYHRNIDLQECLTELLAYMRRNNLFTFSASTSIYIRPGYDFKVCDGLITNFHQPKSTLLLLVAAFIGADWKKVYDHALANDYRFLSYGDSSLLIPKA